MQITKYRIKKTISVQINKSRHAATKKYTLLTEKERPESRMSHNIKLFVYEFFTLFITVFYEEIFKT